MPPIEEAWSHYQHLYACSSAIIGPPQNLIVLYSTLQVPCRAPKRWQGLPH